MLAVDELVALARPAARRVDERGGFATALVVGSSGVAGARTIVLMTALVALAASSLGAWRGGRDALGLVVGDACFRRCISGCRSAR